MTRDEVCQEFGAWYRGQIPEEVHWSSAELMADEIVRLREQLAAVTRERDAMEGMYRHHAAVALDAIEKLNSAERILAALREPTATVWNGAWDAYDTAESNPLAHAIRAAVAAAEQEATP